MFFNTASDALHLRNRVEDRLLRFVRRHHGDGVASERQSAGHKPGIRRTGVERPDVRTLVGNGGGEVITCLHRNFGSLGGYRNHDEVDRPLQITTCFLNKKIDIITREILLPFRLQVPSGDELRRVIRGEGERDQTRRLLEVLDAKRTRANIQNDAGPGYEMRKELCLPDAVR